MASQDLEDGGDLQRSLSEKLQLLHLLSSAPVKINRVMSISDATEGAVVDAIATCLQGPVLGDITAVVLDRRHPLTFVLMKNRALQECDRLAAQDFFKLLCQPLTPAEILRFIMTTSTANLSKVKTKVAVSQAIDILRQRLQDYEPTSLRTEFIISAEAVALISSTFATTDAKKVLSLCLDRFQGPLAREVQIPVSDGEAAELHRLMNTAKLFSSSIFFSSMLSKASPDRIMSKFQRRLEKLVRYDRVATLIVNFRDRFSHDEPIGHRWVELLRDGCQLPNVAISPSPLQAVLRSFPSLTDNVHALHSARPSISDQWLSTVQLSHHVEILLLCNMHLEEIPLDPKAYHNQTRMIGCSRSSCPCCHVVIKTYNSIYATRWKTTRTDGRRYGDWPLLSVPRLDAAVQKWVDLELGRILQKLLPSQENSKKKRKRKRSER